MIIILILTFISAAWLSLSYGWAFVVSRNRFFLIHALRWALIIQYLWLLSYLFDYNILPTAYAGWVLGGIAGAIIFLKWLPMLRNRYSEGPYITLQNTEHRT